MKDWIKITVGGSSLPIANQEGWDLTDLEAFFKSVKQWPESIIIDSGATIVDVQKMASSHVSFLKHNAKSNMHQPYYNRLMLVKQSIEKNK